MADDCSRCEAAVPFSNAPNRMRGQWGMDRFASMETFVAVYETGSFSAAARKLSVGQPAVSKSVALLELHLGARLLTRSTRELVPTEAGHQFYLHARQALDAAAAAEDAARGNGASLRGLVRVSAATTFARLHIVPHLPALLARHPELCVDILLDDGDVDLMAEGVEVALRMGDLADSALTAQRIARIDGFTYRVVPYDTNLGWILIRIRADTLVPATDPTSAASIQKNVVEHFAMSTLANKVREMLER